jgi:hypothetical protein
MPVGTTSPSSKACSSLTPSGMRLSTMSPNGMRMRSDIAPLNPPKTLELPKTPPRRHA